MLAALQSLYKNSGLAININGNSGRIVQSHTGVKQGCLLSPTLFGLYVDGMHRYLMSSGPVDRPVRSTGVQVPDLAYADAVTLMTSSPQGLQRLIDILCQFCAPMDMIVSVAITKIMVFNLTPGPLQWTCGGEQLEIVIEYKYIGILLNAVHGMAVTFLMLGRKIFAVWALRKRQYGRLQCLFSVGLMFRVYEACVPPAAAYACKIWAFQRFSQAFDTFKLDLATSHIQLLKEVTGVRANTSTDILLAELGLKSLQHVWLLRAAKFWNNLADKPHGNTYRNIALDGYLAAIGSSRPSALQIMNEAFGLMPWISLISQL